MLVKADQEPTPDGRRHPLDAFVVDPTGRPPLCDETRFAAILQEMAADEAPRLFAVMQEYGDRVDAKCAAWGMAFDDHVEVVGVEGTLRTSASSPEDALRGFRIGTHITPRLVWVKPEAATRTELEDAT